MLIETKEQIDIESFNNEKNVSPVCKFNIKDCLRRPKKICELKILIFMGLKVRSQWVQA